MIKHNCETSRVYKQRLENQQRITDNQASQITHLEERRDELKKVLAGVSNIAALNRQYPSRSNMDDILDLINPFLHED
jgi:Tfp pilus assembly protein PilO